MKFINQYFGSIIKEDVFNVVLGFFSQGWLLPNFNSNIIVLIPKTEHVDTMG
jgi:hypothetical protein